MSLIPTREDIEELKLILARIKRAGQILMIEGQAANKALLDRKGFAAVTQEGGNFLENMQQAEDWLEALEETERALEGRGRPYLETLRDKQNRINQLIEKQEAYEVQTNERQRT